MTEQNSDPSENRNDIPCSELLKSLADETRYAVVRLLFNGPLHAGDLVKELHVEQSLLSHHLKMLREANIVVSERAGKAVLYSLAPEVKDRHRNDILDLGCCELSFKLEE